MGIPFVFQGVGFSLLAISFTGVVAVCATPVGSPVVRKQWSAFLTLSPLRFVGRISYCLYLVHTAVFAICSSHPAQRILLHIPFYNPQGWSQVGISWMLAFIVSALSWYLFESPILRLKLYLEDRPAKTETAVAGNS
jgi:peptidoglycan/LPS O-acetylase OafA/YrhL